VTDKIERSNAVVIAGDSLAVDNAGARAQVCQRPDNQRETTGKVIARTAIEAHSLAVLPGDDTKAVVLDFVEPLAAGWQLIGFCRKARRDEPSRQGTLQHMEQIKSRNGGCNGAAGPCVGQLVICAGRRAAQMTSPGPPCASQPGGSGRLRDPRLA